jgi:putative oxidoreductase
MTTLQASTDTLSGAASGPTLVDATELLGRILLSIVFFASGIGKITGYASVVAYMAAAGVPSALLPLAIVVEVLGPLALVLGWHSRLTAVVLAAYSIVAALLFHFNFADPLQAVMFLKNLAIAGGLLLLVANGAGSYSLDARKRGR